MDKKSRSQRDPRTALRERTAPRKVTDLPPRKGQDVKGRAVNAFRTRTVGDVNGT